MPVDRFYTAEFASFLLAPKDSSSYPSTSRKDPFILRYPRALFPLEERSKRMAIARTTSCSIFHSPPYQFMTAEYHSIVYGAKINPRTGQSTVAKTPANHVVKK